MYDFFSFCSDLYFSILFFDDISMAYRNMTQVQETFQICLILVALSSIVVNVPLESKVSIENLEILTIISHC